MKLHAICVTLYFISLIRKSHHLWRLNLRRRQAHVPGPRRPLLAEQNSSVALVLESLPGATPPPPWKLSLAVGGFASPAPLHRERDRNDSPRAKSCVCACVCALRNTKWLGEGTTHGHVQSSCWLGAKRGQGGTRFLSAGVWAKRHGKQPAADGSCRENFLQGRGWADSAPRSAGRSQTAQMGERSG